MYSESCIITIYFHYLITGKHKNYSKKLNYNLNKKYIIFIMFYDMCIYNMHYFLNNDIKIKEFTIAVLNAFSQEKFANFGKSEIFFSCLA